MSVIEATWIFPLGVNIKNVEVLSQVSVVPIILEGASQCIK
jgi:hypothetical protein